MLIVPMVESDLRGHLKGAVSLAAINAPSLCVATGPVVAIDALEEELEQKGVLCQRLRTSHAFHSEMMDPAVKPFVEQVARVSSGTCLAFLFLSNVTGTWISSSQATDPAYWGKHLREAVRFSAGVTELAKNQGQVFLEIGPGRTLRTLAQSKISREFQKIACSLVLAASARRRNRPRLLFRTLWLPALARWSSGSVGAVICALETAQNFAADLSL